jgi:glycine/D-amino acid oxidase-like deaminating enzyme
MASHEVDTDCIVLGGGSVGTLVAMLCAEQGYRCLVFRLSDQGRPEAESLRNQAWLQSGALFTRVKGEEIIPSKLSLRLRTQGRRLLSLLNLPEEGSRGLVRFPEGAASEIETFIEDARELGLGRVVRRVADTDARRLTGPLYRKDTVCVEVPDAPFDEAGLLVTARARARAGGAQFIEVDSPVVLEPDPEAPQWRLVIGGEHFRAPRLVLAAGIGNLKLLEGLGVEHDLSVRRTPLLVIPRTERVEAPILIDRSLKLAVARHGARARPPSGCLVAGVAVATPLPSSDLANRQIPREEWEKIYAALPPAFQPDQRAGHRFTCGYEVMREGPNRVRKEDLIVERVNGFKNLVLALPGRATLAYRTAELVLEQLAMTAAAPTEKVPSTDWAGAGQWTGPIHLHHQSIYDGMDERVEEEP